MLTATQAYNAGSETWVKYQAARARGDSTEQAIGQIAGTIGGGAACVAAGAAVVAPICASLGGTIGRAIGGLFGAGGSEAPDYAPAICAQVERALDDLAQDAAANGVSLPRSQLRAWLADAADRASLARQGAPKIQIVGELGRPGARLLFADGKYGVLDDRGILAKNDPHWIAYRMWLPWSPNPVESCLWQGTVVRNPEPVIRMASIGLSAVAARIVDATALRKKAGTDTITIRGGKIVSGGPPSVTVVVAAVTIAVGIVGFNWWRKRK